MMDLHWTGAALLLALATLGPGSSRGRRNTIVDWTEFAREHGVSPEDTSATPEPAAREATVPPAPKAAQQPIARPATRPARQGTASGLAPRHPDAGKARSSNRLRATATCGHCGREAGALEWDAAAPLRHAVLRPADGAPPHVVPVGARLRCAHCGGPVFAEAPEPVFEHLPLALEPALRGRPRKAAQRAS